MSMGFNNDIKEQEEVCNTVSLSFSICNTNGDACSIEKSMSIYDCNEDGYHIFCDAFKTLMIESGYSFLKDKEIFIETKNRQS